MTISARALSLTIDANSGQDMVMLLKQALYEIEQLLPPPHDASDQQKSAATMRDLTSSTKPVRVTSGHSNGSIGGYAFDFIHNSRAYHVLEQILLNQGYVKSEGENNNWETCIYYIHSTLPPKCIDGMPLCISDAPEELG